MAEFKEWHLWRKDGIISLLVRYLIHIARASTHSIVLYMFLFESYSSIFDKRFPSCSDII